MNRRPEIRIDSDGVRLPRAWLHKEEFVRWSDILAITRSSLIYRRSGSGNGLRSLAALDAHGVEEIEGRWREFLRLELERSGAVEGGFAHADTTPIALNLAVYALGAVAILRGVTAMARTVAEIWPAVEELPGSEAQTWMLLTLALYSLGGMAVAGVVAFATRQTLVMRRFGRLYSSWRLGRDGLHRRSPNGESALLAPTAGDTCDQSSAVFAGEKIPVSYLSGGELVRELLLGLAHSRGASVAWRSGGRTQALRIVLVWPALVWGGWWLAGRLMGLGTSPPIAGFVLTELAAAVIAAVLWTADDKGRRTFEARVERARALVDTLGW